MYCFSSSVTELNAGIAKASRNGHINNYSVSKSYINPVCNHTRQYFEGAEF